MSLPRTAAALSLLLLAACGSSSSETPAPEPTVGSALAQADAAFPGLDVATALSQDHANRGERIDYPDAAAHPPLGGNHAAIWMKCQAYPAPVPTENAVHSLEHGAVWVTYSSDLPADQVAALDALAPRAADKVLVSPREQDQPVYLTAWGRQLAVQSATDPVVQRFVDAFADGPQTPEPGATCDSPVDQPGDVPWVYDTTDGQVEPSASTETVPAEGTIP